MLRTVPTRSSQFGEPYIFQQIRALKIWNKNMFHVYKFEVINRWKDQAEPRQCEKYSNEENFKHYFEWPTFVRASYISKTIRARPKKNKSGNDHNVVT